MKIIRIIKHTVRRHKDPLSHRVFRQWCLIRCVDGSSLIFAGCPLALLYCAEDYFFWHIERAVTSHASNLKLADETVHHLFQDPRYDYALFVMVLLALLPIIIYEIGSYLIYLHDANHLKTRDYYTYYPRILIEKVYHRIIIQEVNHGAAPPRDTLLSQMSLVLDDLNSEIQRNTTLFSRLTELRNFIVPTLTTGILVVLITTTPNRILPYGNVVILSIDAIYSIVYVLTTLTSLVDFVDARYVLTKECMADLRLVYEYIANQDEFSEDATSQVSTTTTHQYVPKHLRT